MSELPRRIVSHLRRFIGNRRRSKRVQARLSFTLSLTDPRASSNGSRRLPTLDGYTLDVSVTGLALIVPAIRIGEHYLAGAERKLHLKLELAGRPIEMKVESVRYESLEDDTGYLIGARIVEMSDADRASFEKYVAKMMSHQPAG
jgi:PilZ domain-containing protein